MDLFCIYLLPVYSVVNTLLSLYLLYKFILVSPRWKPLFVEACAEYVSQEFPLEKIAQQKLEESGMAALQRLIERRYDGFIEALKQRIPMASIIITGSIAASLKELVEAEIAKLLPELKQLIAENLIKPAEVKALVKAHLEECYFDHLIYKIQGKYQGMMLLTLVALSFILGVIQLGLILIFC